MKKFLTGLLFIIPVMVVALAAFNAQSATSFNPNAAYRTVTTLDNIVYIYQNGSYYDQYGNIFSSIPNSKNGYTAPVDPNHGGYRVVSSVTDTVTFADLQGTLVESAVGPASSVYVETLPSAATYNGYSLTITQPIASSGVTSASLNVVPITGGAAASAVLNGTAGKWATLQSNGTNWVIIQSN